MRAYIQTCKLSDSLSENAQDARYGFLQRGYEIVDFSADDLYSGKLDYVLQHEADDMVLYGGCGTVREAVRRAGAPDPVNMDLPESLRAFWGRGVTQSTMGEIRHLVSTESQLLPVHVKPLNAQKLFTGLVVREFKNLIPSASVPAETPVLVQQCVNFLSEWRAYVLRGQIINVGNYRGDPLMFPDRDTMQAGLAAYAECPVFCAMDWGVTDAGETLLVEVNDGHSLGSYSLRCNEYVTGIIARWRQMLGLPDTIL